jgi:hypothetical protein
MKIILFPILLLSIISSAQVNSISLLSKKDRKDDSHKVQTACPVTGDIDISKQFKWKFDRNRRLTGGLIMLAGLAKGFNEAIQYKYNGFEEFFPKANDQWFYPTFSYKNKYKDGDPTKGPRFPLSTSVLVMFTDQYHLNNFIQKSALTAALVLKIGNGKKPLKHYLLDLLYYTACYQAGFHAVYQPISMKNL